MALVLKLSITLLIFSFGLSATLDDVAYVWRRPALLAKSLLAMYVVVPIAAVAISMIFALPPRTELAITVLAICAGAPLLPKKVLKFGGNATYIFSLIVATSVLAILTVPAGLNVISTFLPVEASVDRSEVASTILQAFLLPLGAGMLLRAVAPAFAEKAADKLLQAAGAVLAICALVILVAGFHLIFEVGAPSLIAFALFTAIGLAAGHLLGGPHEGDRTALAIACASRHIGLAMLVAAHQGSERSLELVVGYLVASGLVSLLYIRWRTGATTRQAAT